MDKFPAQFNGRCGQVLNIRHFRDQSSPYFFFLILVYVEVQIEHIKMMQVL